MDAIKLKFYGDVMCLSTENNYKGNINTCRMNQEGDFVFSIDYLIKKFSLLHFYISPIVSNNNVTKIILEEKKYLSSIKNLINLLPSITCLHIEEEVEINISDKNIISEMTYIKKVNCFDMDSKLLYNLETKNHKDVILRSEILFESKFMIINKIDTTSKLCHIKEVVINEDFSDEDKYDFEYLLNNNKCLNKIILTKYSKEVINYLKPIIKERKILLSILNDSNIKDCDYKQLKNIKRKDKLDLELSYTKQYQQKHAFKQLNVNLLRLCMVMIIFVCVGFVSTEHYLFEKDKESIQEIENEYEEVFEKIEEVVPSEIVEEVPTEEVIEQPQTPTYVSPYYQSYSQVINELKNINPDTIGWIKVNNTNVNYPVVKSTDNSYYLNHSFDKSSNSFGWIYADYRSNFDNLNQNTILYGHNVQGTNLLFGTLTKTLEPSWYNNPSNLVITFNTASENIQWQIFSIYLIPVTNDYLITNFNSPESFLNFVQKLKDRSIKDFGVEVLGTDQIITLSTCYKDSSSRVVIHAKRIK